MRTFVLAALTTLTLAACASPEDDPPAPPSPESPAAETTPRPTPSPTPIPEQTTEAPTPGEEVAVDIVNFVFKPGDLTVDVGTTVRWEQLDRSLHTVDFEDGEKSGDMEEGDSYSRTFDEPGEYPYICFYHPRMTGVITVR